MMSRMEAEAARISQQFGLMPGPKSFYLRLLCHQAENHGKIAVLDEDSVRYTLPANGPALNEFGRETGYSWGEEFEAGRLYVGQWEDGSAYGQVWAQSALPEPTI